MPKLTYESALKELKQKNYRSVYFFHGEEDFFIDQLTQYIEKQVLPEEQKAFNQTVIYGKDIASEPGALIDMAMRLPMMAERQVIVVKEAQNIKKWDLFIPYIESPTATTLLVFAHKTKKLDGRSGFAKKLAKQAGVVESSPIRDYEVPKWIDNYVATHGYTIDAKGKQLLADFLGSDLQKIANELNKLFLAISSTSITPNDIEKNIGISKDYNVFELQNAFLAKDTHKIFAILDYFSKNPKAGNIVFVITILGNLFSKLFTLSTIKDKSNAAKDIGVSPYFFKDYLSAAKLYSPSAIRKSILLLHEYDLKSKGLGNVTTSPVELLRELSLRILHIK